MTLLEDGHVFVSYSQRDMALARLVVDSLRASGVRVWWDQDLRAGFNFRSEIEDNLQSASRVVVLWTSNSRKSKWVRMEAEDAESRGVLLPLVLDGSALPFGYASIQALDFKDWDGDLSKPSWQSLLKQLRWSDTADRKSGGWTVPKMFLVSSLFAAAWGASAGAMLTMLDHLKPGSGAGEPLFDRMADSTLWMSLLAMPVWWWATFLAVRSGVRRSAPVISIGVGFYGAACVAALTIVVVALVRRLDATTGEAAAWIGSPWIIGTMGLAIAFCAVSALKLAWQRLRAIPYRS